MNKEFTIKQKKHIGALVNQLVNPFTIFMLFAGSMLGTMKGLEQGLIISLLTGFLQGSVFYYIAFIICRIAYPNPGAEGK